MQGGYLVCILVLGSRLGSGLGLAKFEGLGLRVGRSSVPVCRGRGRGRGNRGEGRGGGMGTGRGRGRGRDTGTGMVTGTGTGTGTSRLRVEVDAEVGVAVASPRLINMCGRRAQPRARMRA